MRNIWMYWESQGKHLPEYIALCIESIKKHKGNLSFNLLDQNSIADYLPDLRNEWHQLKRAAHKADYVRTRLVHQYGGIWIDCDMAAVGELEPLFDMPDNYDYGCQSIESSIGCFLAKPGCPLLAELVQEQDKVLDRNPHDFKWYELGNGPLRKLGPSYKYWAWKQWTLDEIPGNKAKKLLSRSEQLHDNLDKNAILFHFNNEATGRLINMHLRQGRTLKSNMLISKILRHALAVPEPATTQTRPIIEWIRDTNFSVYTEKAKNKIINFFTKSP